MNKLLKYNIPNFLENIVTKDHYKKWLHRKAMAHIKRDRNRGNNSSSNEEYKVAIHNAVIDSCGFDAYTGEALDWSLISKYDNIESKKNRRAYKEGFSLLPSIDHVGDGLGVADFKICSWRTNAAKSELTHTEFYELCLKVVEAYNQSNQENKQGFTSINGGVMADQQVKDKSGKVLGVIRETSSGSELRNVNTNALVGTYDKRTNETRSVTGRVVGKGNLLATLM